MLRQVEIGVSPVAVFAKFGKQTMRAVRLRFGACFSVWHSDFPCFVGSRQAMRQDAPSNVLDSRAVSATMQLARSCAGERGAEGRWNSEAE